ncbi:MAG: nucleotidyltransferase domain-containing protein [Methanobrevibacter sp.]|nr:nucleotidyltransferase domain-containing protein [Methanobrevibacter sp.]MEA4957145.1 nucleotidyltransferase domain-containing protein [Methanobrevibacter sp.]
MNRKQLAMEFANSLNNPEIEKIILFGSVARGDDTKDSDIDILILTTDEDKIEDDIFDIAFEILIEKNEYISPKIIPIEHYEKYKNTSFYTNVNEEGIVIG